MMRKDKKNKKDKILFKIDKKNKKVKLNFIMEEYKPWKIMIIGP